MALSNSGNFLIYRLARLRARQFAIAESFYTRQRCSLDALYDATSLNMVDKLSAMQAQLGRAVGLGGGSPLVSTWNRCR